MTDSGIQSIENIYKLVSEGSEVSVLTHRGRFKKVIRVFKHPHSGAVLKIKPSLLPPIECTPVHEIFAAPSLSEELRYVQAKNLNVGDYLWAPAPKFEEAGFIDLKQILPQEIKSVVNPRKLNSEKIKRILTSKATSLELGKELGLYPSYVRRIRKHLRNGAIAKDGSRKKTIRLIENQGKVKYTGGKTWAPRFLELRRIAKLLGYYCAEGNILRHNKRPNSLSVRLCFGNKESGLIRDSCELIEENFHVKPRIEKGKTRTCVVAPSAPIAYMFSGLCGEGALNKKVPKLILSADTKTVREFLRGLISGDGSRSWDKTKRRRIGLGSTSRKLILDCISLLLRLGYVPSFTIRAPGESEIGGRLIHGDAPIHSISLRGLLAVGAENEIFGTQWIQRKGRKHYIARNGGFLLKIKEIEEHSFKGNVFDLEVEDDHSFTCPFVAVSNCKGYYLKHMISCQTPDALYKTCVKLASNGAHGVLLSGGYNPEGYVPFEPFLDAIERVKRETGLFISAHTGLAPSWLARELGRAGVDLADFDLIGDDETIGLVLGIDRTVEDYRRTMKTLKRSLPYVAPHICIGLHAGDVKGERKALELAAEINPHALAMLVLVPTPGTGFEHVAGPSPEAVGRIIAEARIKLPETTLALGCMRPRDTRRVEFEFQALSSGIDRVELPSEQTLEAARKIGLNVRKLDTCCAVPDELVEATTWSKM